MSLSAAPGSASQRFHPLVSRLTHSGQWDRLLGVARDWLAEQPESTEAHQAAGQALVNLRRHKEALVHLDRLVAGHPGSSFGHRLASIAGFNLALYRRADHHIQEAIRLSPLDPANWYHLAWMRYKHGAYDVAAKHARRSLELAPNEADTINLLALCERAAPAQQYARYLRALELEPENSVVHNNLGVYHLNVDRNYGRAADCFRRALAIDPTDRNAQNNLHVALREYDSLYKLLQFPRLVFGRMSLWRRGRSVYQTIPLLWFLLVFGQVLVVLYGVWLVFGFPLLKAYEALTLRDLREQAGVPGARRGGWFGFWRWPSWVRAALLLTTYFGIWAGIVWLCSDLPPADWIVAMASLATVAIFIRAGRIFWTNTRRRYLTWRGERSLRRIVRPPQPPPLPRS